MTITVVDPTTDESKEITEQVSKFQAAFGTLFVLHLNLLFLLLLLLPSVCIYSSNNILFPAFLLVRAHTSCLLRTSEDTPAVSCKDGSR